MDQIKLISQNLTNSSNDHGLKAVALSNEFAHSSPALKSQGFLGSGNKSKKSILANRYLGLSLSILSLFNYAKPSEYEEFRKDKEYEKYSLEHERIKQANPGARSLDVDKDLKEAVLKLFPKEATLALAGIKQNISSDYTKKIILHGLVGTGKSSIAQSIAIESQTPCLIYSVRSLLAEHPNSIIQILRTKLESAKNLNKPCIAVFDDLEVLIKTHAGNDKHDNLLNFLQELDDSLKDSKVIAIGTINSIENLPPQITNRSFMIKATLPDLNDSQEILSHHLNAIQKKHKIEYPNYINGAYLAQLTKRFSHGDLKSLVDQLTNASILDKKNNPITETSFSDAIKKIKQNPVWKLEREMGTWKHSFKTNVRDPRAVSVFVGTGILCGAYLNFSSQKESRAQSQRIADKKESRL